MRENEDQSNSEYGHFSHSVVIGQTRRLANMAAEYRILKFISGEILIAL